ncbi:unnamed protein product [Prorocentrum cordatum]|uniref:Fibronectin type-III domain-containing protein n=1 Tax=Prorocentrum cordatum TaxID=2364126 RepID=A0ABN9UPL3_9DINO|nr:unnamed protein product [Polarella glacialis]
MPTAGELRAPGGRAARAAQATESGSLQLGGGFLGAEGGEVVDFEVYALTPGSAGYPFPESTAVLDRHPVPWDGPPSVSLAAARASEVELEWSINGMLDDALLVYEVQMSEDLAGEDFASIYTGSNRDLVVSHLDKRSSYRVRVRAFAPGHVSGFGQLVVRPCDPPSAPASVRVAISEEQGALLSLVWEPPREVGGCAVTGYQVFEYTSGGLEQVGATSGLSFTPDGGVGRRAFQVCASTVQVECGENVTLSAYWAVALPPPQLEAGDDSGWEEDQAVVAWDPVPLAEGEQAEVHYAIEGAVDGSVDFVPVAGSPTRATSATIGGLLPGALYRFRGAALRAVGGAVQAPAAGGVRWSEALALRAGGGPSVAAPLQQAELVRLPGHMGPPRRDGGVSPAQGTVSLSWDPPAETHGLPVEAYELQHDDGLGGEFVVAVALGPERTSLTLGGIYPSTPFRVRVRARTAAGWSEPGPAAAFLAVGLPGSPQDLRLSRPAAGPPVLHWVPPSETGGLDAPPSPGLRVGVTHYLVWLGLPAVTPDRLLGEVRGDQASFELRLEGLHLYGEELYLYVTAHNGELEGAPSSFVTLADSHLPGPPSELTLTSFTSSSLSVSWDAPAEPDVSGYELYWDCGRGDWADELVYSGASTFTTVSLTGCSGASLYRFSARARNANGWSATNATAVLSLGSPPAPTAPHAVGYSRGALSIAWAMPQSASLWTSATWFEVHCVDLSTLKASVTVTATAAATLEGLAEGRPYRLEVRACSPAGCGPHSGSLELQAAQRPQGPTAPRRIGSAPGAVTVGWSEWPGTAIVPWMDGYEVRASSNASGPYVFAGYVSAWCPPLFERVCGSVGAVEYLRVAAVDSSGLWPEGGVESDPVRVVCAQAPDAPPAPEVAVQCAVSDCAAEVTLGVAQLHGAQLVGWKLLLHNDGDVGHTEDQWSSALCTTSTTTASSSTATSSTETSTASMTFTLTSTGSQTRTSTTSQTSTTSLSSTTVSSSSTISTSETSSTTASSSKTLTSTSMSTTTSMTSSITSTSQTSHTFIQRGSTDYHLGHQHHRDNHH